MPTPPSDAHAAGIAPTRRSRHLDRRDDAPATPPPMVDSTTLFSGGGALLRIAHADQVYLLRITRENKLILTK
ncbi:hemin uptake protein HemP [Aquabacterium sp.]|uniref:hemin uptake protein HemP n=1 Tax=Aquabacterium sp. TaxID=1872578 RepID=UPI0035AEAB2E